MYARIKAFVLKYPEAIFIISVLLFVNLYSLSTLTTKPAYWYDEAMNVEMAGNFADFGKLDLIVAPNTFSGKGATVGSTGYTVTVPLAGFFKVFGFGLKGARIYMLLWMSAFIISFFYIAKKLWGTNVAYFGTFLIATFAPFYGNCRSVMGEIPGFLFFLLSFYLFEQKKWWYSGLLLGLAVVSKPSIYIFLIPAFALTVICENEEWKKKLFNLVKVGGGAVLALVPWFVIYANELSNGGLLEDIINHFKNPYKEAGFSVLTNISTNLPTIVTSTTLLYMEVLLAGVIVALFTRRELFRKHKNLFILSAMYLPLSLLQYLKSFGYLRYFIASEFLIFILFLITLPVLARSASLKIRLLGAIPNAAGTILAVMILTQVVHLFAFADLYSSTKTQKTILHIYSTYPIGTIGVINVPQVGSFVPSFQKYQYLSTYGLSDFGTHMLYLSPEKLPNVIVTESPESGLSKEENALFNLRYEKDISFTDGFSIYTRK